MFKMSTMFWCARLSPALPAGAIPAPARGEPPHREPSLGRMEVTTWAKRRQSDTWAVTQVKPHEPRDKVPDADTLEHVEGQGKVAVIGKATGRPAGSKGTARVETEVSEEPGRSHVVLTEQSSMPTERTIHREADATGEVGALDSTPRVGKPRPWGSEGTGHHLRSGHISSTQREVTDVTAIPGEVLTV